MSQSSALNMQTPNPMKKKIITALIAVVVGHMGVLWAVGHMKTPELKPIEKEPLKVRFVKIQEPPKPIPPKPKAEPKKEKPKPKEVKKVEIVKKQLPPPPKKVEKVQQVKKAETPKPVVKPVEAPPKPTVSTTISETKVAKPVPVTPPPAPPAPVAPPAPPAPPSPKNVSIGGSGVQWSRSPKPSYSNGDLEGQTRTAVVYIEANEKGVITSARMTRSTGIADLDEKILRAVRNSKFKPYKENGVAYPIKANLPLELTLNPRG
ncbi:energy transducer TonB family protein [Acinetobacter bouvetii]|uniref:Gram-negative bacterial tonB protein n=1 Tax=Acinetobacter bouvetii TaxID=202951 RepID=A0A811G7P2_9GAMM|nr:energy transducer TonB [Acinetobacter bouvetii]CAB1208493.1 Gram-negative bacterial tonB protein [Acinetobacter bouvetii]